MNCHELLYESTTRRVVDSSWKKSTRPMGFNPHKQVDQGVKALPCFLLAIVHDINVVAIHPAETGVGIFSNLLVCRSTRTRMLILAHKEHILPEAARDSVLRSVRMRKWEQRGMEGLINWQFRCLLLIFV